METLIFVVVVLGAIILLPKKASGTAAASSSGTDPDLDNMIRVKATKNNIPFEVVKAVCFKESSLDPKKFHSGENAVGLMQVRQPALTDYNNANATSIALDDLYNAETNLEVGCWYLGGLIERNGLQPGVEMYNVGETGYKHGHRNFKYMSGVFAQAQQYA